MEHDDNDNRVRSKRQGEEEGQQEQQEQPSDAEVEHYALLYKAQLRSGDSQGLEEYQAHISASQRSFFDDIRQKLRVEYHAEVALERRNKLASLLAQTPPFTLSSQDYKSAKTGAGQKRRAKQFDQFIKRYALKSSIGVHPFFAALARLLEYQGSGRLERSCVWLLDDAVLMESGGDDWMESVVWILKGVLHFQEERDTLAEDPFMGEAETMRRWTVSASLSDPECRRLARLVPAYVLPRRGRGSKSIERAVFDVESVKEVDLPTGKLRLSNTLRDDDYRGSLMQWLWTWLFAEITVILGGQMYRFRRAV